MYVMPPHCPYLATAQAGALGSGSGSGTAVVGAGAALVTIVVGTGLGELDSTGAGLLPPPEPPQTAGPGTVYVVAFLAASESMLNAMPGSVLLYAPGNATR